MSAEFRVQWGCGLLSHTQLCKYVLILEQEINYLMEIALKKISFLPFGKYFYFMKKLKK
jgi:hypothetical protein